MMPSITSSSSATVRVDKATSEFLIGPDWTLNMEICDIVNSNQMYVSFQHVNSFTILFFVFVFSCKVDFFTVILCWVFLFGGEKIEFLWVFVLVNMLITVFFLFCSIATLYLVLGYLVWWRKDWIFLGFCLCLWTCWLLFFFCVFNCCIFWWDSGLFFSLGIGIGIWCINQDSWYKLC